MRRNLWSRGLSQAQGDRASCLDHTQLGSGLGNLEGLIARNQEATLLQDRAKMASSSKLWIWAAQCLSISQPLKLSLPLPN